MLRVQLLQTLTVSTDVQPAIDLGSPKARSLFAYLVLHHQESIDRRRLAFHFWPRSSESAARRNLREYLYRLRRALEGMDGDLIQTNGHQIRFKPPADWWLDVAAFETLATPPLNDCEGAVALYAGELLADVYEDWVAPERERLARLHQECLIRLSDKLAARHNWADALHYAERFLTEEPLLESANLRVLRLHQRQGGPIRLRRHYEQFVARLEAEIGASPSAEFQQNYQQLLTSKPSPAPLPPVQTASHVAVETPCIPFIGRKQALQTLTAAFERSQTSRGSIVLVEGGLGVGKTRLVSEWQGAISADLFRLQTRAHEFENMIPYAPLREILDRNTLDSARNLFQTPPPWLSALLPLIPTLTQIAPSVTTFEPSRNNNPTHIIQALGSLLFTLARHKPVLMVIDNLHWADTQTWNVLAYLAQRIESHRLLIVATIRVEDLTSDATRLLRKFKRRRLFHSLPIVRFSAEETQQLVQQMMGEQTLDPRFVRRLYEETEGNPFFIIETVQAVQEAGGDWTQQVPSDEAGNRPMLAIPLSVQDVIESRLDQLSDDSRTALSVAAAIGREFTFDLLQQVSRLNTNTLLDALDEWLARGLVRERDNSYDFTHEQFGHVAYEQLSRARRQWIHLQVGDYLANRPNTDPAQLAHHFYASSDPARALPYLAQAGQRALRVRSYAEAREFGLRAIGLSGRFPATKKRDERIDLNLQLAQAYAFSGSIKKALDILQETERLAEQVGDMQRLARIIHQSSQLFWLRGLPNRASNYARRTLRHAEELKEDALRLAALRMLGRTSIALSEFDDAIAFLIRYGDLDDPIAPTAGLSVTYGYLGVAYARVGSWQRAIDAAQRGVDLASVQEQGATHVVACMQQAFIYAELQEWETALAALAPVRDVWRENGMSPHAFMMRIVLGRCLAELGDYQKGTAEIRAALQWAASADHRVFVHIGHLFLARTLQLSGDVEAYGLATKSAEMADSVHDRWASAVARRTQAIIDMQNPSQTNWPQAEQHLLEAMRTLRQIRARPDLAHTLLALRRLYDRAGQVAWAIDCHFRATTIFEELGMESQLKIVRGQPATGERTGAVVIPGLDLRGPNRLDEGSDLHRKCVTANLSLK